MNIKARYGSGNAIIQQYVLTDTYLTERNYSMLYAKNTSNSEAVYSCLSS